MNIPQPANEAYTPKIRRYHGELITNQTLIAEQLGARRQADRLQRNSRLLRQRHERCDKSFIRECM
jgi:hypothetical protein